MAESRESLTKVWIEPGCIICNACESTCPDVFHVGAESSTIRPEAMNAEFLSERAAAIRDAAAECPAEVIKFEASEG